MIDKDETEIAERWIFDGHIMTNDKNGKRIDLLISSYLQRIANDESGWSILYKDPNDNRYWENTFPNWELQGGGPRTLKVISEN